ncbi:type VI secretion system baseplate subunit TssK [Pseudomonas sp. EpS/L25]|uniref:type VI secretion system baseplate subunit TssK n=1 Tax=Pseudomonas sp. EpS/L25 TaxID=1749078 RepID=UPI0007443D2B|nr:type VI secretion system baseplate subunit TssK [Pseudomonas sp. EpS/L25]KUM42781.1 type VI secretion protein [Pseudomonas sp. EpS/L25]
MQQLKVIWQEGMLLRPQHFQQNDRYHAQQLQTRTRRLGEPAWGFFELALDRQFLAMGKLVVSQASGILPDGTLFELGADSEPLALDVPANTCDSAVWLALPLASGQHVESRPADQDEIIARYLSVDREIPDSHAGFGELGAVTCGRPDFRLLLDDHPRLDAYVRLQVCQILEAAPDGSLGTAEIGDFLLLQLVNRHEAVLRHCLDYEQLHPRSLFRELLALHGELATFAAADKRPAQALHYRHSDQGGSFEPLFQALRQALSMVLEQHALPLPLQQRQYGIQVAPLQDHGLLATASFVLIAGADCSSEELRQRLPAHLKVGPVERIRQLVNLHLPGLTLKALPVAPRQLPFHADKAYFALELTPADLALLEQSGGFAFHVSGTFPSLDLAFWAIRS